ncbi:hypothetical protein KQX54_008122 [Cotesia glomerata]|uniref:Uncharacterized protein n=1 Tax=Cotesia glomerata TaxID=32391 RepID=A0AAV7IVG0_COTGL|nr:hypothetical protein KQX54_008122 [Cotesia glomerata]
MFEEELMRKIVKNKHLADKRFVHISVINHTRQKMFLEFGFRVESLGKSGNCRNAKNPKQSGCLSGCSDKFGIDSKLECLRGHKVNEDETGKVSKLGTRRLRPRS